MDTMAIAARRPLRIAISFMVDKGFGEWSLNFVFASARLSMCQKCTERLG
jgi:hypothetical protein